MIDYLYVVILFIGIMMKKKLIYFSTTEKILADSIFSSRIFATSRMIVHQINYDKVNNHMLSHLMLSHVKIALPMTGRSLASAV